MKNKGLLFLGVVSLLLQSKVYALAGTANIEFEGNDKVNVGETFTIKMDITDVNGTEGIVSLEGNLVFDENMIEYVSSNKIDTPYEFYINENYNYKMAGLDLTLENGILENTTIYEFTFKAISEGNTEITLKNYKLTDRDDYVNASVIGKNIVIENVKEEIKNIEDLKEETIITEEKQNKENETKKLEEEIINQKEIKNNKQKLFDKIANIILNKIMRIFK